MSKIEIGIPDDGWFSGGCNTRPQDKQLCVIINKITGIPMIGMYLENILIDKYPYSTKISDCFFDVIEAMKFYIVHSSEAPIFLPMGNVDCWKPLGLPSDVNDRILAEIGKWFNEDNLK